MRRIQKVRALAGAARALAPTLIIALRPNSQELQNLGYAESKKEPKAKVLATQAEFHKWGRICRIGDASNPDDMTKWTVMMRGPSSDVAPEFPVYEGAIFKIRVEFPPTYPFKMPKFTFIADGDVSIPFHPNVLSEAATAGEMCNKLIIGGVDWKGTMDAFFVLSNIYALLAAPSFSDIMAGVSSAAPYRTFSSAEGGDKAGALAAFAAQVKAACPESFDPAAQALFSSVPVPHLHASIAE